MPGNWLPKSSSDAGLPRMAVPHVTFLEKHGTTTNGLSLRVLVRADCQRSAISFWL